MEWSSDITMAHSNFVDTAETFNADGYRVKKEAGS
jgi:hypothetical protein